GCRARMRGRVGAGTSAGDGGYGPWKRTGGRESAAWFCSYSEEAGCRLSSRPPCSLAPVIAVRQEVGPRLALFREMSRRAGGGGRNHAALRRTPCQVPIACPPRS